jgi:lactoylglutathione lyase
MRKTASAPRLRRRNGLRLHNLIFPWHTPREQPVQQQEPWRSPAVSDRPFRVLGVQQIAIGSVDKEKLKALWVDALGLQISGNFKSERENVDEDIVVAGSGALKLEVDLMQPIDPEKKPKVQDPPLNHIGLWIDDLPAAVEWLGSQGVRFTPGGIRRGGSGYDICFIHPKGNDDAPISGQGVLIELVQAPPEVISAYGG